MDSEKNGVFLPDAKKMEALGRFSGKLAHDLNNILGAIEGYSTLAGSAMKEDDPSKADMLEIRQTVAKAADLMRQFLVFSGRGGQRKVPCDVAALLDGLRRKEAQAGAKLELEAGAGLPPVSADPAGLERALLNLLANAREAMPGGGSVTLRAEALKLPPGAVKAPRPAEAGSEFVKLSVADTGPGINPDKLERLFEPFFTTKEQKSAGLGLAVVYGIAANHNGWVEVRSEPGRGSEFSIFLPTVSPQALP